MFELKKIVSFWLMPLPLCMMLLVIGVCLLRSTRRAKVGRVLVTLATALLLVFSNKAVSTALIRPLEAIYPSAPEFAAGHAIPEALANCRYIVVLGGGHGDTPGFPATTKLSTSARARLMEGVRLMNGLADAKLVTSGRGAPEQPTHAKVMADAAVSLGADRARIQQLDTPRDTEDEAIAIRSLVGDQPFALVTSAWHMRRAAALMRKAGLEPIPCPTDYAVRPSEGFRLSNYSWDSDSIGRSTWAIRERIGYLWSSLRGKV